MKAFWLFLIILFALGVQVVFSLDRIIFKDGTQIEAKVIEVTPSSIKYQYPDRYGDQNFFIHVSNIHSIHYENGTQERIIFKQQSGTINSMIIGVNLNGGGAIPIGDDSTPSINVEFTYGNFNSEINIIYSLNLASVSSGYWGIGGLAVFNYMWEIPFGLIYIGGGAGYIFNKIGESKINNFIFGANINYRYLLSPGMYMRAGVFVGGRFSSDDDKSGVYFRPDIGVGYSF